MSEQTKELYANFRGAQLVEVIRIEVNEGEGVESDPIQRVVYYVTKDGKVIGHDDDKERAHRGVS